MATPLGPFNIATEAAPPSPLLPATPVPAIVDMIPVDPVTYRILMINTRTVRISINTSIEAVSTVLMLLSYS